MYYAGQKAWHLARRQLVVTLFGRLCIYQKEKELLHHGYVAMFTVLFLFSEDTLISKSKVRGLKTPSPPLPQNLLLGKLAIYSEICIIFKK